MKKLTEGQKRSRHLKAQKTTSLRLLAGKRMPGESTKATVACNDWLRLGIGRTKTRLVEIYRELEEEAKKRGARAFNVPTTRLETLSEWSTKYGWDLRAESYDAQQEARRTMFADHIMRSGYAQPHERVHALKRLAGAIERELYGERGLYGTTLKSLRVGGGGESFSEAGAFPEYQIIEEEFFRAQEVRALRGTLDDLAKETGGRVVRADVGFSGVAALVREAPSFGKEIEASYLILGEDGTMLTPEEAASRGADHKEEDEEEE